jgi:hypothetical protein
VLEGASWREEQAALRARLTAWLSAAFARTRKLPPLREVLGNVRAGGSKRQSPEDQATIVQMLAAAFGGTVTQGNPGATDGIDGDSR